MCNRPTTMYKSNSILLFSRHNGLTSGAAAVASCSFCRCASAWTHSFYWVFSAEHRASTFLCRRGGLVRGSGCFVWSEKKRCFTSVSVGQRRCSSAWATLAVSRRWSGRGGWGGEMDREQQSESLTARLQGVWRTDLKVRSCIVFCNFQTSLERACIYKELIKNNHSTRCVILTTGCSSF